MMCTGRNVAIAEVYKIITQFFRVFDAEISNASQPWKLKLAMAVVQSELVVKLTPRKQLKLEKNISS
jgi:hypothetical protein